MELLLRYRTLWHAIRGKHKFRFHNRVRKISGSEWQGRVVGFYSTRLTPIGYAVETEHHTDSIQIYPEGALERVADV